MPLVAAPLVLLLSLRGAGPPIQTRPDFSGIWTTIATAPRESAETITLAQTADTLTLESPSPWGVLRWVYKLDGSESKNVTRQGFPTPRDVVQVSTTKWDGATLVTRMEGRSNADGPFVVQSVFSLDGNQLVIRSTQTSQKTGAVMNEQMTRYSK